MTLLPARVLPVNDAHGGPFLIRADLRDNHARVYVRRDSDEKTWACRVQFVQEILAPSQQARALELTALITCLYHGISYDATSAQAFGGAPLELTRREVAFAQPESWSDDQYRLTARLSVRSSVATTATAATARPVSEAAPDAVSDETAAPLIPVVEIEDEDIVIGLNFSPSGANIEQLPIDGAGNERLVARLQLLTATFPNAYMNWEPSPYRDFVRSVKDGVFVYYTKHALDVEATLEIVHTRGPALCLLSMGAHLLQPTHTATYQPTPHSDLSHTVLQFATVRVLPKTVLQVVVLPGSACALRGTTLTLRELTKMPVEFKKNARFALTYSQTDQTRIPVLPILPLPVNDVHSGPLLLRVHFHPRQVTLYVKREADKRDWRDRLPGLVLRSLWLTFVRGGWYYRVCTVRTLQEILAPTQQARPLNIEAVVTRLYNRFAVDTSDGDAPLELTRREVAFFQPESWTNDSYRLTMRLSVRATAVAATATPAASPAATEAGAADTSAVAMPVPIVEIADDSIVFGFNFEPTKDDITRHTPILYGKGVRRSVTLKLLGAAFPHGFLNWAAPSPDQTLAQPEKDRIGLLLKVTTPLEFTLTAVHTKGPALVVLSLMDRVVKPTNATTYQPLPGGDLHHTVLQYNMSVPTNSYVQVIVLPGSSCLVEGTTMAIREVNAY